MDKEQILNEINKTKEHLANMEKMLEECKYARWKPINGELYYFVDSCGKIVAKADADYIDSQRYKNYNCFQTEEQVKSESEKILVRRMLEDIARRLNKGKEIDWESHEYKFHLLIFNDVISQEVCQDIKYQGTVYCLDGNFKDIAIREIGEERLKAYLRGE